MTRLGVRLVAGMARLRHRQAMTCRRPLHVQAALGQKAHVAWLRTLEDPS